MIKQELIYSKIVSDSQLSFVSSLLQSARPRIYKIYNEHMLQHQTQQQSVQKLAKTKTDSPAIFPQSLRQKTALLASKQQQRLPVGCAPLPISLVSGREWITDTRNV